MSSSRPNIVFFLTDDQRFDTINALGNPAIQTPNMDRLVRDGCAFTHAHIPCGTSPAICMPSRAMIHSGRSLFRIEGAGQAIPPEHTTLGEALRANGYRTFGTGKWHNGRESFTRSFSDGEEIFFGGMADHWNVPAYHFDPTGKYDATLPEIKDPFWSREVTQRPCDHIQSGRHSSETICGAAVDFIDAYADDDPFFAYVSFLAPHDPRSMPERFKQMYPPEAIELPPNFMGGHPFDTGALFIRAEKHARWPRDPDEIRTHIAEYYAMITHLDHELGRVIEALERKGLYENTIIVFAGDNGLALGQHGLMAKQSCYEHSVRVPLIVSGPGIPRGKRSEAFVYLFDLFPTLCELTGTAIPASVEGRSLLPAIQGDDPIREALYFAYIDKHRAVRTRTHKLIEYVVNGRHNMTQLFDLAHDPWERENLAGRPESADLLAELRARLYRLRDEWGDATHPFGEAFWAVYPDP